MTAQLVGLEFRKAIERFPQFRFNQLNETSLFNNLGHGLHVDKNLPGVGQVSAAEEYPTVWGRKDGVKSRRT